MKIFQILTLFPDLFPGTLDVSIFKKSKNKAWDLKIHDLRKYGIGKHKKVDDEVFGGLPGMLIRPDVIDNALADIKLSNKTKKIFLSPKGKMLNQKMVEEFAASDNDFFILCGRYEGVDQRVVEYFDFEEISIGNYVLAGGELAALVFMESVIRKIPEVIGNQKSFENESFVDDQYSEKRYTRPAVWETLQGDKIEVEKVLISGNHAAIKVFQKAGRKDIIKE